MVRALSIDFVSARLYHSRSGPTGLIALKGGNASFVTFLDAHFDGGHNDHTNEPRFALPRRPRMFLLSLMIYALAITSHIFTRWLARRIGQQSAFVRYATSSLASGSNDALICCAVRSQLKTETTVSVQRACSGTSTGPRLVSEHS